MVPGVVVETGDKNHVSEFHCIQMSRVMSMRGLFSSMIIMIEMTRDVHHVLVFWQ